MQITVTDLAAQNRYEAHDEHGNRLGILGYLRDGTVIDAAHTEVDPEYEGRGVGSTLVRHALDRARADGLAVRPSCPFVRDWIDRHPDYQDLLAGEEPPA